MPDQNGTLVYYWDSVVFISFLTETKPERVEAFRRLVRRVEGSQADARVVLSTLTVVEVRPRHTDNPLHAQVIEELFRVDRPYLQFIPVTWQIANLARRIAGELALKNADAIHLATAVQAKADVFCTYDGARDRPGSRPGHLLKLDRQIGDPPMRIVTPDQAT